MPEKNKNFVAYMPALNCKWIFTKEVEAETIAETYDEVLSLCHDVFQAGEHFLIPTRRPGRVFVRRIKSTLRNCLYYEGDIETMGSYLVLVASEEEWSEELIRQYIQYRQKKRADIHPEQ